MESPENFNPELESVSDEMREQENAEKLRLSGLIVTAGMTTPSKPGKKPRPVWTVSGRTAGYEEIFRALDGKKYRGAWSFWDDPTDKILQHLDERMTVEEREEYKARRKLEKAERYEGYAENATERSNAAHARVKSICDRIPMGQPILVGHHSEKSARADQRRIHRGMEKAVGEYRKSKYLTETAAGLKHDATSAYTLRFIGNRIADAEKEISRQKANLEGRYYVNRGTIREIGPEEKLRYEGQLQDAQDKLAFWHGERLKLSENKTLPSSQTITVGMWVKCWSGLRQVEKVNAKSVTIRDWWHAESRDRGGFTRTIKYHDIKWFVNPSSAEVAGQATTKAPVDAKGGDHDEITETA